MPSVGKTTPALDATPHRHRLTGLTRPRRAVAACIRVILYWGLACAAMAQLPIPKVAWIFPAGAQAGTTNLITVSGTDLDDPLTLVAGHSGIVAEVRPNQPGEFTVVVPTNHPAGSVGLRFSGRFGLSNPRPFQIGTGPELFVPSTNNGPTSATFLPLETTANGRVNASMEAWFRFEAKAGQRLFAQVAARELASRLVPELMVTDLAGRELARARRRELLDFAAPTNGTFLLRLNDQTYRGGADYHFRLRLTAGPHIDFALPNSLRAGETNRVTLFGRNLPGGISLPYPAPDGRPWERLTVEIAAPARSDDGIAEVSVRPAASALATDAFNWNLTATNGPSNPLAFALTTNATTASWTNGFAPVTPPCDFSGLFPAHGEATGVTFAAKKGDVLWLELYSDRLGFPTDPLAVVQRERATKGERGETLFTEVLELGDTDTNLGDREFNTASRDAAARFEAPETGNYRVSVRDLFNTAAGRPRYAYRLSLRRETPDFRLVALAQPPPKANNDDRNLHVAVPVLRRGQTLPIRVLAFRRDGFSGAIELSATNLPRGVTAALTRIPGGQNSGVILLTANADSAGATSAKLLGRAWLNGENVTRAAPLVFLQWPVPDYNNESAFSRVAMESLVSVCAAEQAPITLAPAEAKAFEAPVGGKLSLPLSLIRRGDFQAAFSVKPAGHPELDKAKETSLPEKSTNATVELNLAELKLPEGTHSLWFQGAVAGKYRNQPEALATAETALKEAEQALAAASDKDKPPLEERRKSAEAAKKSAEERAKPRDLTLPVWSQPFTVKITPAPKPEEKK